MTVLPQQFIDYTSRLFGEETWQRYIDSFDEETPVSIRLNRQTELAELLHLPIGERIPWSERGYYLTERPAFTLDPLLHAGAYYVQEASSQYLDEVLRLATKGLDISYAADFCAAPGGKTLILKDHLPANATLIANEYVRKRAWILAENIAKAMQGKPCQGIEDKDEKGCRNIIVTNNSTADIARCGIVFDLIVCDVPCSGEGMFRKDRDTIKEWSMENVRRCAELQREIVSNAWQCLREGGILVYSTCTFNQYEDEDNLQYIIEELGGEIAVSPRKFIPGTDKGEGQFMVAVRRKATQNKTAKANAKAALKNLSPIPLSTFHFPLSIDVSLQDALNYLRGQAIILPPETPKGIVAICYKGHFLGTAKNIGSRANNLYPKEWRIKHL